MEQPIRGWPGCRGGYKGLLRACRPLDRAVAALGAQAAGSGRGLGPAPEPAGEAGGSGAAQGGARAGYKRPQSLQLPVCGAPGEMSGAICHTLGIHPVREDKLGFIHTPVSVIMLG